MAGKNVVEYTPAQREVVCDYLTEQCEEGESGFVSHEITSGYAHNVVMRIIPE